MGKAGYAFCSVLSFCLGMTAEAQVTAPSFNPSTSASVTAPISVVVTCTTSGTTTYTTDGQTPVLTSTTVANSGTIPIYQSLTLKARTFSGSGTSAVTSAEYFVTGMVSSGFNHSVALTFDGKVFAWGDQTVGGLGNGQLGAGTIPNATSLLKSTGSS